MIYNSWVKLKQMCPSELDLDSIVKLGQSIEQVVGQIIEVDKLDDYKQRLIMCSGELETLILNLMGLLSDLEKICITEIDKGLLSYLKDDSARFLSGIDEKQNLLLEAHDGEPKSGIGRTTAFKKILRVSLDLVYYALLESSIEYDNLKLENKPLNIFLRMLFIRLSMKFSISGGVSRKSSSLLKRANFPTTWKAMFTKEGVEEISEGLEKEYGNKPEIKEEDILFKNLSSLEEEEDD